jgi:hypothetical protein
MDAPTHQLSGRTRRRLDLAAGALLLGAVVLATPLERVDPDELSHLAVGRSIVLGTGLSAVDPFTFLDPARALPNPEWLGDATLFLLERHLGPAGPLALKLLALGAGWLLALALARRLGASPLVAASVLALGLPGAVVRFTLRNQIHATWLVPATALLLLRARRGGRTGLAALVAAALLGVLWANSHASFVLGELVVLALVAQEVLDARAPGGDPAARARAVRLGVLVLLLYPLLGTASPFGAHNYGQLLDHLLGAPVYRAHLLEWQAASQVPSPLARLPLLTFALLGAASFLPRPNRRQAFALVLILAGVGLSAASQRFLDLLPILAGPPLAANLTRLLAAAGDRLAARLPRLALLLAAGTVATAVGWGARTDTRAPVLERPGAPVAASRFFARSAPPDARLFAPYDAGPWLLYLASSRVRLYIDPRNVNGAAALARYLRLRANPLAFEAEAARLSFTHALVDAEELGARPLRLHLAGSSRWRRVFSDPRYSAYERRFKM